MFGNVDRMFKNNIRHFIPLTSFLVGGMNV